VKQAYPKGTAAKMIDREEKRVNKNCFEKDYYNIL
jgi:hypothetical protein